MMPLVSGVLAAMSVFLFCAYVVRARALRPAETRLRGLAQSRDLTIVGDGGGGQMVLRRSASAIPALTRLLSRQGYVDLWTRQLERADSRLRPGEYFLIRLVLGVFSFIIIGMIGGNALSFLVGILAGFAAFMLPAYWLRFRIQRRVAKINGQLVETITLIANAVRAGFAFAQGVDVAAKQVGPPISTEFNRMLLDVNLGASIEDALRGMNDRVESDDLDMVVTAILIQRNTGGNLVEVLESVTATMRDRERIQGEIRTMTAQQRLTGWVLSAYPVVLAGVFFLINPKMTSLLWTTTPGYALLVIWVTLNVLGFVAIRKILDIEI